MDYDDWRSAHGVAEPSEYKTKDRKMTTPRYLWVRPNSAESPLVLIDDPEKLFRGNQFDESIDKLYQIGNEVKFKVSLEPVPNYHLGEDRMKVVRAVSGSYEDMRDRGIND